MHIVVEDFLLLMECRCIIAQSAIALAGGGDLRQSGCCLEWRGDVLTLLLLLAGLVSDEVAMIANCLWSGRRHCRGRSRGSR